MALAGLVALGAAWVTTPPRPPAFQGVTSFTATHTLILDDPSVSQSRAVDLARAALLAKTGEVPQRVVAALDIDTKPAILATRITVRQDSEVRTVAITAAGEDGPQTALLADTFASELVKYLDEREQARQDRELSIVKGRMDDLQRQSTELDAQIPGMARERQALARAQVDALVRQFGLTFERFQQLAAAGPASLGLVTLEKATPIPIVSGGFRPPESRAGRIGIAVPLGLLLGVGMVLLAKRVDTRIATKDEAERAFGLPVVAEIPRLPRSWRGARRAVDGLSARSPTAEAYRTLRSSVRLMAPLRLHPPGADGVVGNGATAERSKAGANGRASAEEGRVILVASPGRREGRTTVVVSLAASFARTARKVIVLDFDRLKPEVASWLGAPAVADGAEPADELAGGGPTRAQLSSVPGVRIMTEWLDPGDTTEAMEAGREAVVSARRQAEVVLIDTPPLLTVSDAGELVSAADAVILVCRAGRTTAESAARASELLGRLDAAVLGVVLVGVPSSRGQRRPPNVARTRRREPRPSSRRAHGVPRPTSVVSAAGETPQPAAALALPAGGPHSLEPVAVDDPPDRPDEADSWDAPGSVDAVVVVESSDPLDWSGPTAVAAPPDRPGPSDPFDPFSTSHMSDTPDLRDDTPYPPDDMPDPADDTPDPADDTPVSPPAQAPGPPRTRSGFTRRSRR